MRLREPRQIRIRHRRGPFFQVHSRGSRFTGSRTHDRIGRPGPGWPSPGPPGPPVRVRRTGPFVQGHDPRREREPDPGRRRACQTAGGPGELGDRPGSRRLGDPGRHARGRHPVPRHHLSSRGPPAWRIPVGGVRGHAAPIGSSAASRASGLDRGGFRRSRSGGADDRRRDAARGAGCRRGLRGRTLRRC